MRDKKPLILIGFKHVGKSVIAAALAKTLNTQAVDLDKELEKHYFISKNTNLNCRQIAQKEGLEYFRELESECLHAIMKKAPQILSVGGGTPLLASNRELLKQGTVLWIKAPQGRIYERIKVNGRPAFFPEHEEAYEAFIRVWNEREPVYAALADHQIDNLGTVEETVQSILNSLKLEVACEA